MEAKQTPIVTTNSYNVGDTVTRLHSGQKYSIIDIENVPDAKGGKVYILDNLGTAATENDRWDVPSFNSGFVRREYQDNNQLKPFSKPPREVNPVKLLQIDN